MNARPFLLLCAVLALVGLAVLVGSLSRATVYNALGEFVAAELLGLVEGPGPQLYDANAQPHHHFRCRHCRRLYDVHPNGIEGLTLAERGFRLEGTQVLLKGLCPRCR